MAVAGGYYAPKSGSNGYYLVSQVWSRTIEPAVYERSVFISNIREFPKLNGLLHIRKLKALTTNTLAQDADGTALTYSANAEVEVQLTPAATYCAVAFARNQIAQMDISPISPFVQNVEDAMQEGVDTQALSDVPSLTQFLGDAATDVTATMWRQALTRLRINAKSGIVQPGETTIYGVLHPAQLDDILAVPEFTHADVTGRGDKPLVEGIVSKAMGINLKFSGVVTQDANGAHGVIYIPSAFGVSWNERVGVETQKVELQERIIAYCNFGHNVVHDLRAVGLRTKAA